MVLITLYLMIIDCPVYIIIIVIKYLTLQVKMIIYQ